MSKTVSNTLCAKESLAPLLDALGVAGAQIARAVAVAPIENMAKRTGVNNASGDDQTTLDVLSHKLMVERLQECDGVAIMLSEEEEGLIQGHADGEFAVCFDPLDGSSNVESSMPTGTIFSIFRVAKRGNATMDDLLQCGNNMVAAGYVLYSSATIFVATLGGGSGVESFVLDPTTQTYTATGRMAIPEKPQKIISANAGRSRIWDNAAAAFLHLAIAESKPYTFRYTGAMVADLHRTLINGGVFFYPADRDYPEGKLRILYECFPLSMIFEEAGGQAVYKVTPDAGETSERILDLCPASLHQRTPIYAGCNRDVDLFKSLAGAPAQGVAMLNDGSASHQATGMISKPYAGDPDSDELTVKRGQLISSFTKLSDPKWMTVTILAGEKGLVPASCVDCFDRR